MIDKLKDAAITHGMKLMSDPRVMKMMSDPRVMSFMMKAFEVQNKFTTVAADTTKAIADRLQLANREDFQELKNEVLTLRERMEALEAEQEKGEES